MSEKTNDAIERIRESIRTIESACKEGITFKEKEQIIAESAAMHTKIMQTQVKDKNCSTCDHCCMMNGVPCCRFRNMAEIPFEVVNRVGGCKHWYEKDFIPFAFAFMCIGGGYVENLLQML